VTNKQRILLILSVALSIAIWGFLYGPVVGTAFTLSLLFHEYGHYYWMGREGIRDKTMIMMPPFGAVAMSKESWPSLGAEARIALAGPGFGLVSAVVLLLAGMASGSYEIMIAAFAVCLVNLLNFWTPVAVLDGGRVVKSLLFSFNANLGFGFYTFSLIALIFLVGYFFSIFTLVLGFLIYRILESDRFAMWNTISSGKLIRMSRQELVSTALWFLVVSVGLYTVMTASGVKYADFISYIISK